MSRKLSLLRVNPDDLNTPEAIKVLHELAKPAIDERNTGCKNAFPAALLKASANLLGLLQQTRSQYRASLLVLGRIFEEEVREGISVRSASTFFVRADGTYSADDATLNRVNDLLARRDAARISAQILSRPTKFAMNSRPWGLRQGQ